MRIPSARPTSSAQPLQPARPVRPEPAGRVSRALGQAVCRLREARIPFRVGQLVVGDDPFNGRREGTVAAIRAPFVGVRVPGTPAGTLLFFDHRDVRLTE